MLLLFYVLQELAALSEKSTGQSKIYEGRLKDMEIAIEERKRTLEKIEAARDDLTIELRKLEQSLQEKDIKVEVNILLANYETQMVRI